MRLFSKKCLPDSLIAVLDGKLAAHTCWRLVLSVFQADGAPPPQVSPLHKHKLSWAAATTKGSSFSVAVSLMPVLRTVNF